MKNAVKNNLFITKSKARFQDKFDYTHTDYSSAQEEVVITCMEQMFLDDEVFYKVGITGKSVKKRFGDRTRTPYLYEVIKEINGPADKIYDLENEILRDTKDFLYTPRLKFPGYTEARGHGFLQAESVSNLF